MARNVKERRIEWGGNEVTVQKLSLNSAKPNTTPSITLVGAVAAAGTGAGSAGNAGGAVATQVFTVEIAGTTYYVPLCATNA